MADHSRFTQRAQRIWDAAYAAAYVADFFLFLEISDYDRAIKTTTGERASYVADQAVRELRRWKQQESAEMGVAFQNYGVEDHGEPFGQVESVPEVSRG